MKAKPLAGLTVLITRPKQQAAALSALLKTLGADCVLFPTLLIKPLHNTAKIQAILNQIERYDYAVFVSANAVMSFNASRVKIIAIGPGTARALEKNNMRVDFMPATYNSEGLLALPILRAIKNKRIVIFCGENSKPLLKDSLITQGAQVEEALCYRRERPMINHNQTLQLQSQTVDVIVSTSKESLQNLAALFPKPAGTWLYHKNLVVISQDMAALARELGFGGHVIVAPHAGAHSIVDTLTKDVMQ